MVTEWLRGSVRLVLGGFITVDRLTVASVGLVFAQCMRYTLRQSPTVVRRRLAAATRVLSRPLPAAGASCRRSRRTTTVRVRQVATRPATPDINVTSPVLDITCIGQRDTSHCVITTSHYISSVQLPSELTL